MRLCPSAPFLKSAALAALLGALALPLRAADSSPPVVLVTVGMLADPLARIAGDCVQVVTLIGPDVDPHLFQPRPSDIQALQRADGIVAVGLDLEGRMAQLLARLGQARPVLLVGETLPADSLIIQDGAPDPHLWMDPGLWAQTFPAMARVVRDLAPDCAAQDGRLNGGLNARLNAEIARARALDDWARTTLASLAAPVLITGHDAFGYMARAYGLENLAIQGISTNAEPSVAEIETLAALSAARAVPAVFVETTLSPRAITALVQTAAALGHRLVIGGELYTDALGQPGTLAETWPGMIVHNVTTLTQALGGVVAPLPVDLLP